MYQGLGLPHPGYALAVGVCPLPHSGDGGPRGLGPCRPSSTSTHSQPERTLGRIRGMERTLSGEGGARNPRPWYNRGPLQAGIPWLGYSYCTQIAPPPGCNKSCPAILQAGIPIVLFFIVCV